MRSLVLRDAQEEIIVGTRMGNSKEMSFCQQYSDQESNMISWLDISGWG